jgi:hypothetical protein
MLFGIPVSAGVARRQLQPEEVPLSVLGVVPPLPDEVLVPPDAEIPPELEAPPEAEIPPEVETPPEAEIPPHLARAARAVSAPPCRDPLPRGGDEEPWYRTR